MKHILYTIHTVSWYQIKTVFAVKSSWKALTWYSGSRDEDRIYEKQTLIFFFKVIKEMHLKINSSLQHGTHEKFGFIAARMYKYILLFFYLKKNQKSEHIFYSYMYLF